LQEDNRFQPNRKDQRMVKVNKRSKAPRPTVGPRVGVTSISGGEVVVSVLGDEPSPLPRSVVYADDDTPARIAAAVALVAERVRAALKQPVPVVVR